MHLHAHALGRCGLWCCDASSIYEHVVLTSTPLDACAWATTGQMRPLAAETKLETKPVVANYHQTTNGTKVPAAEVSRSRVLAPSTTTAPARRPHQTQLQRNPSHYGRAQYACCRPSSTASSCRGPALPRPFVPTLQCGSCRSGTNSCSCPCSLSRQCTAARRRPPPPAPGTGPQSPPGT